MDVWVQRPRTLRHEAREAGVQPTALPPELLVPSQWKCEHKLYLIMLINILLLREEAHRVWPESSDHTPN